MYTIIIICLTTVRIIAYDNNSKSGMNCTLIEGQQGKLKCNRGTRVHIRGKWIDNHGRCAFNKSTSNVILKGKLFITCPHTHLCYVTYQRRPKIDEFQSLKIFFQCEVDSTTPGDELSTESHDDSNLQGDDFSTESEGGSSLPGEEFSSDVQGVPMYAFIVGGIVGVLIITCITVGVIRLRRRNGQRNARKNVQGKLNQTNDTTQDQEAFLMNSPDSLHMPASHAVNLVISTDASNTYSHLRSTEDDSDVMYDHTVRHNVHNTCEGDYGIAHRRITEDDYDVSGNYRQSCSNKEDPVYN